MIKRADQVKKGDVILLGPCDPKFTVESIAESVDPKGLEIRARPDVPTGEEGKDGCEAFLLGHADEVDVEER